MLIIKLLYYLIISQKKIFTNELKYSNIIIIKNCGRESTSPGTRLQDNQEERE